MMIFEPSREPLDAAQLLAIEQGVSVKEIAAEIFSAYVAGIKAARIEDIGELYRLTNLIILEDSEHHDE